MIEIAGGTDLLGRPAERSRTLEWAEVAAAAPEVILYMPCGYGLTEAVEQLPGLCAAPELRATPAVEMNDVFVTDSSAYFSRSGPRLIDGLEILAGILHPDLVPPPDATRALRALVNDGEINTVPVH
jgi:iron complex transport system substrate-binding protein